jgi:hypothetical protein
VVCVSACAVVPQVYPDRTDSGASVLQSPDAATARDSGDAADSEITKTVPEQLQALCERSSPQACTLGKASQCPGAIGAFEKLAPLPQGVRYFVDVKGAAFVSDAGSYVCANLGRRDSTCEPLVYDESRCEAGKAIFSKSGSEWNTTLTIDAQERLVLTRAGFSVTCDTKQHVTAIEGDTYATREGTVASLSGQCTRLPAPLLGLSSSMCGVARNIVAYGETEVWLAAQNCILVP